MGVEGQEASREAGGGQRPAWTGKKFTEGGVGAGSTRPPAASHTSAISIKSQQAVAFGQVCSLVRSRTNSPTFERPSAPSRRDEDGSE